MEVSGELDNRILGKVIQMSFVIVVITWQDWSLAELVIMYQMNGLVS
jgi:hypothetical protein